MTDAEAQEQTLPIQSHPNWKIASHADCSKEDGDEEIRKAKLLSGLLHSSQQSTYQVILYYSETKLQKPLARTPLRD
ncbi:hypothetical protein TNCT_418821 [Trichonephila clavata]|uniref:Uncharacterized protein n=1 Tax=Trichonephila clavata TaxID=2740835 RepID=A0A8X6GBW7_TRICU|nr:hypothetical protein TNCT_418821 [Trichonephila clavata]